MMGVATLDGDVIQVDEVKLREMVRRIVDAVHPDRIILFGSRARGDARPDSDYDLLIVAPSDRPAWDRTGDLYNVLRGLGASKDIIWYTPEEADEWRNVPSELATRAQQEGRVVYERPA